MPQQNKSNDLFNIQTFELKPSFKTSTIFLLSELCKRNETLTTYV